MVSHPDGVQANDITYVSVLSACSSLGALEEGQRVHSHVVASGLEASPDVVTAVMNMYAKCGSLEECRAVFERACLLGSWDCAALWNTLITGYVHQGEFKQAVQAFHRLELEGAKPNEMVLSTALGACASLGDVKQGTALHSRFLQSGLKADVVLENALVNMYGKCGNLRAARQLFSEMRDRKILFSWNILLSAYAQHGSSSETLNLFQEMLLEGFKPSETTFISLLYSCNHVGLLGTAAGYFRSMEGDHGTKPTVEHYRCMLDLLGRAGRLVEAEELIEDMPFKCSSTGWSSFLGACNIHRETSRAEKAAGLAGSDASAYVLLSNIYSSNAFKRGT